MGDLPSWVRHGPKPTVTKLRLGSTRKTVLIFGAVYDEDQDSKTLRSARYHR